jgi:WD repeat-containing protein 24
MKSLNTGSPIGTFDQDPSGRFLAVGGRELLKLVERNNDNFRINKNLRTRQFVRQNTSYIQWHPLLKDRFATATLAGTFYIWDIGQTFV